jgi:Ca-activated chloride channel family protein
MSFLSPGRLVLLVVVAALLAAYVVVQRQRKPYALRFTNVELLASVAPRRASWRRHLAAGASLVALALLVLAFARPVRTVAVPRETATVMLAVDVSRSMRADDVKPTRLRAAQRSVETFVNKLPHRFRLGLVLFSGSVEVAVTPTHARERVRDAVRTIELQPSTAIGEAIFSSLKAIKTVHDPGGKPPPARIVLLSDGSTNAGRPNAAAIDAARQAGVAVSTIAFGTDDGTVVLDGVQEAVPVNRQALKDIAQGTGGHYAEAVTEEGLRETYQDIGTRLASRDAYRQITMWFVGGAILAAFGAAAMSLVWTSRLP